MFQFTNTTQQPIVERFQNESSVVVWRIRTSTAPAAPQSQIPAIWRK